MRRIVLALVPLTILAACSSEPAEEPVTEEVPEEMAETPAMTAANGSPAGTYEVSAADGTVTSSTLNADGTYVDTAADGSVLAEGTWAVTDGKTCFAPVTAGQEAMCYTETAPAADGSFVATPDEGDPVTVRPAVASGPA
jgi:hypothetical protein